MIEYKEGRSTDDMVKFVTHDYLRYPTEDIPMEYSFWRSLQKQFNIVRDCNLIEHLSEKNLI